MLKECMIFPGYLLGFRYPTISLRVLNIKPDPVRLEKISTALGGLGQNIASLLHVQKSVPDVLQVIAEKSLLSMNIGMMEKPSVRTFSAEESQLLIPCHRFIAAQLIQILARCNWCLTSDALVIERQKVLDKLQSDLPILIRSPLLNSNTRLFLQAAHAIGVAHHIREYDLVDYGLGQFLRRLQSSFTEQTSVIAAQLARDKKQTGDLLREALLPGSDLRIVADISEAIRIATDIGFPVVLKPQGLDGGVGVFANLQNIAQLKKAFVAVSKIANQIVLERHFEGRDYRLVVYKGKVIWAIEKEYPGVLANGNHSVRQLVEQENRNPLRSEDMSTVLIPLKIDAEGHECLKKQGLTADSIPPQGTFIRLRDQSNINGGGRPLEFPVSQIHPDNLVLAIETAACVGLNLAGIDVLTSHLSLSWKTSGALVCDVNAQPSLGALTSKHLYEQILREELSKGLAPPIVIIACPLSRDRLSEIIDVLEMPKFGLGEVAQGVAYLDGQCLNSQPISSFKAARGLLQRKTLSGLVIATDGDLYSTGLPHFEITSLIIPKDFLNLEKLDKNQLRKMLAVTLAHCQKLIISESVHYEEADLIKVIHQHFPKLHIELETKC